MEHPRFFRRGSSQDLVVLLHAYMGSPARLGALRRAVERDLPDADLLLPRLPAGWASLASPTAIVQDVLTQIDRAWQQAGAQPYRRIVLVGHSLGGLVARMVYVCACGAQPGTQPGAPDIAADAPRPWARRVERIVLLAGMNRGWRISHHLSPLDALLWRLGSGWGNLLWLLSGRPPLIFSLRRGAPFITQLRIHWLHMRNRAAALGAGDALTIQLLGSVDDMVSPEDNVDLVSGRDFVYLDVPYSGHANVIDLDDPRPLPATVAGEAARTVGEARAAVFRAALNRSAADLLQDAVVPSDLLPEAQRREVTDVVFVIHGIRDVGYWTHKIARRVLTLARRLPGERKVLATETSSYGYFPMLPFLLPTRRKEKVEWLMDQYAEALARYPCAAFSFVGHSNGTYLLARALRDYPACRFKHVVFAGSVVRTRYDWQAAIRRGQVRRVLNYVASADWVVAFFPRAIQMLHWQDLGSAGHDGFDDAPADAVRQVRFVRGGHGAALNEANWDAIARFVLTGETLEPPAAIAADRQARAVAWPARVAPLLWAGILSAVAFAYPAIWGLALAEWQRALLVAGFTGLIWKIVTVV
ncbi:MAG: alpha/beta hydrolase [Pseudomonadota bacterium]